MGYVKRRRSAIAHALRCKELSGKTTRCSEKYREEKKKLARLQPSYAELSIESQGALRLTDSGGGAITRRSSVIEGRADIYEIRNQLRRTQQKVPLKKEKRLQEKSWPKGIELPHREGQKEDVMLGIFSEILRQNRGTPVPQGGKRGKVRGFGPGGESLSKSKIVLN